MPLELLGRRIALSDGWSRSRNREPLLPKLSRLKAETAIESALLMAVAPVRQTPMSART
jgi:hypothetical protein